FIYKFISNSVYKSKAYNEKFGNIANTAQNLLFYNSPDIYTEKFGASNIEITDKYLNVTKSSMLEEYMSYYRPSDELCSNLELTGYNVRKISKIKDVYTKDELLDAKIYSCKGKIAVENENEKICKSIVLYDSKTLDLEKENLKSGKEYISEFESKVKNASIRTSMCANMLIEPKKIFESPNMDFFVNNTKYIYIYTSID